MERTTIAFLVLCFLLLIAQLIRSEAFTDLSDNSGSMVTLSLSDLLSLLGGNIGGNPAPLAPPPVIVQAPRSNVDSQFYSGLRDELLGDVKNTVRQELLNNPMAAAAGAICGGGAGAGADDACLTDGAIDSVASQQGNDFLRYVPGKNPNDYIRKDSIPCYGCNLAA